MEKLKRPPNIKCFNYEVTTIGTFIKLLQLNKFMKKIIFIILLILLIIPIVSALNVNTVTVDTLYPGTTGSINIKLENNLNDDAERVSLSLIFSNTQFTPIGSSEDSTSDIGEDETKTFTYTIKASNEIKPGDYEIPYILTFVTENEDVITPSEKKGSIGIKVIGNPDIVTSATADNPILGQKGQIKIKIVNKGFYDARFASLKIETQGITLLSEDQTYIGNIDSDDFETSTFDAIFNTQNPKIKAVVQYKDFDNLDITKEFIIPLQIYTSEQAKELGIIETSNLPFYTFIIIFLIIIWIVIKKIRKNKKLKRLQQNN